MFPGGLERPGFLVAQSVKSSPAMWETWVQSLGWEDPLEKGKATHSGILSWRTPGTSPRYSPWGAKSRTRLSDLHFTFRMTGRSGGPTPHSHVSVNHGSRMIPRAECKFPGSSFLSVMMLLTLGVWSSSVWGVCTHMPVCVCICMCVPAMLQRARTMPVPSHNQSRPWGHRTIASS